MHVCYGNTVDPFNWLEDDYIREGYYPARIGSEVILGLATGGATKYAQGAGYMAKVATAVCLLDTVGNATSVGQGVNDVIRTGSFSLQNTVQILGGGLGLTGNFFGAATKIKAKAPETNMGKNPEAVIGTICATCFVAGTQVVTDEGLKNIQDIKVGDFVLSKDPTTGKTDYKPVVQLIRTQHSEFLVIAYKDANGDEYELKVSREHPFWVADKGWVAARQLAIDDKLVITDETIVNICTITSEKSADGKPFNTYNFEVADTHTYFVLQEGKKDGAFAVWVHNANCNVLLAKLHREIQEKANKVGGALNRWMMSSGAANHQKWGRHVRTYQAIMNNPNATAKQINFAKMIKGRFLDRKMKVWMTKNYTKNINGLSLDSTIPGSGRMRPVWSNNSYILKCLESMVLNNRIGKQKR